MRKATCVSKVSRVRREGRVDVPSVGFTLSSGIANPEDQEPVSPRRHCGETVTMTARVDGMPQWQGLSPLPRRKPWQFLAKSL
jgi:hypothetical protein